MALPKQDVVIPIIDISNPSAEVAKQVLDAASTHGFLFIRNDNGIIPSKDIADMFDLVSPQINISTIDTPVTLIIYSPVDSSPNPNPKKPNTPFIQKKQAV